MAKLIHRAVVILAVLTSASIFLFFVTGAEWTLTLAITAGTFLYHFAMRLAVGGLFNRFMRNRADCGKLWFQQKSWEPGFYERIGVRKWKSKMPTYNPDLFNPRLHTWDEIAQTMCQSELVHETIAVFSFLPILFSVWLGAQMVFIITSVLAALIDLTFAIMQRYNRPMVIRLAERQKQRKRQETASTETA